MEGNYCFTNNQVPSQFIPLDPRRAAKRNVIRQFCTASELVLDIGFNAGHSSLLALSSSSNTNILAIDIAEHSYANDCAMLIAQSFPERFKILWGDSRSLLWSLDGTLIHEIDLVHIDGGHSLDVFSSDLNWFVTKAKIGTKLIVDDAYNQHILELLLKLELSKRIRPLRQNEGLTQEVRVYELIQN